MFSIFAAITSTTLFAGVSIFWKRLRDKGLHTSVVLATGVISIPLWIALGALLWHQGYVPVLSPAYLKILVIWVTGAFLINWLGTYLYRYRALTELRAYEASLAVLVGIAVDIVFFKGTTTVFEITGTVLLFISGIILTRNSAPLKNIKALSLLKTVLPALALQALLFVTNIAIFKLAISYQPMPLYHSVFGETLLYSLFLISSLKYLRSEATAQKINAKEIAAIGLLLFFGTIFEVYMMRDFSVAFNVVLSGIPITIYSVYDFSKKTIKLSPQSILALFLIVVGLFLAKS